MAYGTLSVLDALIQNDQPLTDANSQDVTTTIQEALAIHNAQVSEAVAQFATITTERLFPYGTSDAMEMRRVDEFGAVDVQKVTGGQSLGLPLYLHQVAIGWTRKAMQVMSTATLAQQFQAANSADLRNIFREIKTTLFRPTNTLAYQDRLIDNVTLPVRALLNADGQEPPIGLNGETFDGDTHTHYTASASLTADSLHALIDNVREHGVGGSLVLFISRADEATVRGFDEFAPYVDARLNLPSDQRYATGQPLNTTNVENRAIGVFGSAEVWVKPWVPSNYQVALDLDPGNKPLGIRTRDGGFATGFGSLAIAADHEHYPLRAQHMEREFGMGVLQRHKAAVHFSGGGTYTAPALT